MKTAFLGNFDPPHSTENHMKQAWERQGHSVIPLQENTREAWDWLMGSVDVDLVLWTRTGWDWPEATGWSWEEACGRQTDALEHLAELHIPSVGFHLDRWWGLNRAGQVYDEPFFQCDLVCTADGGHDAEWESAGVNHAWLPPGVSLAECEREPQPNREFRRTPVVWVGSWQHYHEEWVGYRHQLINQIRRRYRRQVGLWPRRGQSLRGQPLTDLYNEAKVVVGDSCLAGDATRYWSDRISETLGRGGFLIHPEVGGLELHYTAGEHLVTYPLGDWNTLLSKIDYYLAHEDERNEIRMAGKDHVMRHHTYEKRVDEIIDLCNQQDML